MPFSLPYTKNTWLFDCFLLVLLLSFVYFIGLGGPALYITDEGRYAEIGREMLLFHSFVTPHLDGLPYFEKPPLAYWLITFFEWVFGLNEWAVRSVDATLAIFMCLMAYTTGRICFNRLTGIWAALILSSSFLFFAATHLLNTDTCLSACLTLALTSFLTWFKFQEEERNYPILLYLAYAACALAVLAKGLIGIVFPGMILFLWLLFTGNVRLLKKMRLFSGGVLFFVIAAPWHVLAQHQNPGFFHEYFYVNQYLRFTTPIMHREMNKLTYLGIFIGGFLPWMFLLIWRFKQVFHLCLNPKQCPIETFLIWWVLSIFLFFSFSNSVLVPYLLPTLPPLALLTAPFAARLWQQHKKARITLFVTLTLSWVLLISAWISAPDFVNKSTKPLAEVANALLEQHPDATLINYDYYFQDFPFYTRHFVQIVNWQDELTYGQAADPSRKILISEAEFSALIQSPQPVYIVMYQEDFIHLQKFHPNTLFLLAESGRYVLATNQSQAKQ